jgi:hypothetical protein
VPRNPELGHFNAGTACIVPLVSRGELRQTRSMILDVPIPESLRDSLERGLPDLGRAALEGVAVKGYRSGTLSLAQVRELLGLSSRWDAQDFLASMGAWPSYDDRSAEAELAMLSA